MGERWVKATYINDEERLGRGVAGSTVLINMALVYRVYTEELASYGAVTYLDVPRHSSGPFVEPPEHFLPHPAKTYPR